MKHFKKFGIQYTVGKFGSLLVLADRLHFDAFTTNGEKFFFKRFDTFSIGFAVFGEALFVHLGERS